MQEFTVNEFISLRLNGSETEIYLNNKKFRQCKYLLISIPVNEMERWDHYESMDEIIKATNNSRGGGEGRAESISPKEAFHGHCSNIQAWVDHGYDYRLLDTRLSIPIVKEIMTYLLAMHEKEKAYVYPKDYWKNKFKRFFYDVVESLDDYMRNSNKTYKDFRGRELPNESLYGKFGFLYKVLFRAKDVFFEPEEIEGSEALREVYAYYLPQKEREIFIRKRSYWERKLFPREPVVEGEEFMYYVGDKEFYSKKKAEKYSKNKNLEYRRFLRRIRDYDAEEDKGLVVSDKVDYLPYLYAKGKFVNEANFSFMEIDGELYFRDSQGRYWKEE